jgi:hypothetical protein
MGSGGYQEIEGVPLGGSSLRAIGSKFAGGGREPCCAFQGASPQISAFQDSATASLIRPIVLSRGSTGEQIQRPRLESLRGDFRQPGPSPTSDEVKRCRGCPKDAIISQMACGSTLPTHGYFLRVSASGGSGRASNKRRSRLVSGEIRLMRKFDSKRCLQIRLLRAIWHAALAVAALAARAACVVVAAIGTPAPSMIGKRKDTR